MLNVKDVLGLFVLDKITTKLMLRIYSAVIGVPIVVFSLLKGAPFFPLLWFVVYLGLLWEWKRLSLVKRAPILIGMGYLYINITMGYFLYLGQNHPYIFLWVLSLIWATDTGAYVFGKLIGGVKLAPKISPYKTWAGFIGGLVSTVGVAVYMQIYFLKNMNVFVIISFSLLLSLIAQLGDLLESWVKRYFGIKDTSSLIPGHGGFLDRLDSLLAVGFLLLMVSLSVGLSIFN